MLQAKLQDGTLITPATISKRNLVALKAEQKNYYCPVCEEKVILRAGDKVIAHFAHYSKASCPVSGGGEGVYHEQGKLLLYEWLLKQRITVELEIYLAEINQRPDFLLHVNGRRIAIEYQCSRISSKEIIKRTNGYKEIGIHVIWILGEKLLKRVNQQIFRIDSFTQTLMHQFSPNYPLSLFYFCPITVNLIKIQDLSFIRNNHAVGKISISSLNKVSLTNLFSANYLAAPVLKANWKQEKKRFRLQIRGKIFGRELQWQQWLYLKQLHYEQLPGIIHLPIQTAYLMSVPGWIWQSKLLYEIIAPIRIGQEFSLSRCERLVVNYRIKEKHFPLINSEQQPVLEYLQILARIGIVEQTSTETFKKLEQIHTHKQLQSAMNEDEKIIEQFFKKNQPKYEHESKVIRYTK